MVLRPGEQPVLAAADDTRVLLIGGEPLGHRFMVWNFVSSRNERIAQAQDDWRAQRFDAVPGETEFIPLPQSQNPKFARQAWPTASTCSMPLTTMAFMPKVTAPSTRGSER